MPNRVIREGLLDSERYLGLPVEHQQFFVNLLLLADDLGCVSLGPLFLRRRCTLGDMSPERFSNLLEALQNADLVRIYEVDSTRYGFIPRFRQRLQRLTPKNPIPPSELYADDPDAADKFRKLLLTYAPTSPAGERLPNRWPTAGQPQKGSEGKLSEVKRYVPGPASMRPLQTAGIGFDAEKGEFRNITTVDHERWSNAYPAIAVSREIAAAAAWLMANPKNRKSNYSRFLVNWFSRAQDRARPTSGREAAPDAKPWWEDATGITEKGRERGLAQAEGENFQYFRVRVLRAMGPGPWAVSYAKERRWSHQQLADWLAGSRPTA
jgi:hypothetical protein